MLVNDDLIARVKAIVDAMTPEEYKAMIVAQRESWVRAFTTPCEHGVLDFEDCGDCWADMQRKIDERAGGPTLTPIGKAGW